MTQRGRSQSSVLRELISGDTVLHRNQRSHRGAGIRDFLEALQPESPASRSTRSITSRSRGRGFSIVQATSDSDSDSSSESLQDSSLPGGISAAGGEESLLQSPRLRK